MAALVVDRLATLRLSGRPVRVRNNRSLVRRSGGLFAFGGARDGLAEEPARSLASWLRHARINLGRPAAPAGVRTARPALANSRSTAPKPAGRSARMYPFVCSGQSVGVVSCRPVGGATKSRTAA